VFQTITTDGHLKKKPSVHQGRGQALIRTSNDSGFFWVSPLTGAGVLPRQIRKAHLELLLLWLLRFGPRGLAYQFVVTPQPDSS